MRSRRRLDISTLRNYKAPKTYRSQRVKQYEITWVLTFAFHFWRSPSSVIHITNYRSPCNLAFLINPETLIALHNARSANETASILNYSILNKIRWAAQHLYKMTSKDRYLVTILQKSRAYAGTKQNLVPETSLRHFDKKKQPSPPQAQSTIQCSIYK